MDPIVEILPEEIETGLGVVEFLTPTNVREFRHNFWDDRYTTTSPPFEFSEICKTGAALIDVGDVALVREFRRDCYRNIWAIFDKEKKFASVVIYKGSIRARFYPDITLFGYNNLKLAGVLPSVRIGKIEATS